MRLSNHTLQNKYYQSKRTKHGKMTNDGSFFLYVLGVVPDHCAYPNLTLWCVNRGYEYSTFRWLLFDPHEADMTNPQNRLFPPSDLCIRTFLHDLLLLASRTSSSTKIWFLVFALDGAELFLVPTLRIKMHKMCLCVCARERERQIRTEWRRR